MLLHMQNPGWRAGALRDQLGCWSRSFPTLSDWRAATAGRSVLAVAVGSDGPVPGTPSAAVDEHAHYLAGASSRTMLRALVGTFQEPPGSGSRASCAGSRPEVNNG
jgi:hypothetical protein